MAILARINTHITKTRSHFGKLFKKTDSLAIANYLDESLVMFLDVDNRVSALDQMVGLLNQHQKLKDPLAFHEAILEREKIVSTGIGLGVAIPHAKLEGYEEFFIAIGVQRKKGIEWNALDGAPVRLVFMIGGPSNRQTEYLRILSHLTMAIKSEERRKRLLKTHDPLEVINLFTGC